MSTAAPVSTHTRCHTAFFTALRDGESTLIAATGELDAANSADFVAHATAYARRGQCLTIDLSRLKFFAVEGFSALQDINDRCIARGATWALISGPAVTRVLEICDPSRRIPVTSRSLQLVAQFG